MSIDSLIFWVFAAAWLVVLGLISLVQLPRVLHEGRRIIKRLFALVNESPLPLQIAKAESDVTRVQRALDTIPSLQRRAVAAVAVIRTTPLVPAALISIVGRIGMEIRAFRQALR